MVKYYITDKKGRYLSNKVFSRSPLFATSFRTTLQAEQFLSQQIFKNCSVVPLSNTEKEKFNHLKRA